MTSTAVALAQAGADAAAYNFAQAADVKIRFPPSDWEKGAQAWVETLFKASDRSMPFDEAVQAYRAFADAYHAKRPPNKRPTPTVVDSVARLACAALVQDADSPFSLVVDTALDLFENRMASFNPKKGTAALAGNIRYIAERIAADSDFNDVMRAVAARDDELTSYVLPFLEDDHERRRRRAINYTLIESELNVYPFVEDLPFTAPLNPWPLPYAMPTAAPPRKGLTSMLSSLAVSSSLPS